MDHGSKLKQHDMRYELYCKVCNRPFSFYRAMLCIRGTWACVRQSVRLTQVGVLLKRLNVGSHKQHHTIAQGL